MSNTSRHTHAHHAFASPPPVPPLPPLLPEPATSCASRFVDATYDCPERVGNNIFPLLHGASAGLDLRDFWVVCLAFPTASQASR